MSAAEITPSTTDNGATLTLVENPVDDLDSIDERLVAINRKIGRAMVAADDVVGRLKFDFCDVTPAQVRKVTAILRRARWEVADLRECISALREALCAIEERAKVDGERAVSS